MSQQTKEDIRSSLETKLSVFNEFHIKIIKPVKCKEFIQFVDDLCEQQIKLNLAKDSTTETNAVWVHLAPPNLHLLGELCDKGFEIHRGKGTNISLYRWLSEKKCLIPPYSLFYIGCGAVVIKDQCVFLIEQKAGDKKGFYGLPNGRADPKQTIAQCAQRQLLQQTNIKAKFKYIIAFREYTPCLFGSVDVYFPCFMELNYDSFKQLKLCNTQVNSYKWVPLKDYHSFMSQNKCDETQLAVSQYITRLWSQGFDFEKNMPNVTKSDRKEKASGLYKFDFHQVITKK